MLAVEAPKEMKKEKRGTGENHHQIEMGEVKVPPPQVERQAKAVQLDTLDSRLRLTPNPKFRMQTARGQGPAGVHGSNLKPPYACPILPACGCLPCHLASINHLSTQTKPPKPTR